MTAQTFFRWLSFDCSELAQHPGAFDLIRSGAVHAVAIRNVYSAAELEHIVSGLERHDPPFVQTWFPEAFKAWFYGRNLNLQSPDLAEYYEDAIRFSQQFDQLFGPERGIGYLGSVLSSIDNGRPFLAPPGPALGQSYMFTTIRAHLEGGFIPPHFDNEYVLRPSYQHLQTLVHPRTFSFVLGLSLPDGGGALEIFDLCSDTAASVIRNDDRAGRHMDLSTTERVSLRIPPGCLVIFDSGRFLHAVSPVQGTNKRWTLCSFMAMRRDGQAMYCWG